MNLNASELQLNECIIMSRQLCVRGKLDTTRLAAVTLLPPLTLPTHCLVYCARLTLLMLMMIVINENIVFVSDERDCAG